jgi:cytochrome P450
VPTADIQNARRDSFDPYAQRHADEPYKSWDAVRETDPIFFSSVLNAWVVTRHDLVAQVLQDPETFSSSGLDRVGTLPPEVQAILDEVPKTPPLRATDPPMHTRLRKPTQAGVAPRRMTGMEDQVRGVAHDLIDSFASDGECDFYRAFAYPYPLSVINGLLGFPREDWPKLHHWANDRVMLAWGNLPLEERKSAAHGFVSFHQYVEHHVVDRRSTPREDLLSDLVRDDRPEAESLSLPELVEQAMGLVVAGHETTANWLTMSLYHLLQRPERWRAFLDAPGSVSKLVEEMLRYDSSVGALWRRSTGNTSIGDRAIAPNDVVYCVIASANRDGRVFESPDSILPGRKDVRMHMTFGRGPHNCIGAALARLEGRVAFEAIAERLPGLALNEEQGPLSFVPNVTLRIPQGLRVTWTSQ